MALDIGKIDKRLNIEETVTEEDVVWHDVRKADVDIYGLIDTGREFIRMPMDRAAAVSDDVAELSVQTAGGRLRLKTDSKYIAIRAFRPKSFNFISHMNFLGTSGFDLFVKNEDGQYEFLGVFKCKVKENEGYEAVVQFETRKMRDITIYFPLFAQVHELFVGVQENAALTHGDKYAIEKPVYYYGSSITHGGCASRPGNCHTAMLSRMFDYDYVNLGFSGSAKGEKAMAEYLAEQDMSVFVLDYDFNSSVPDLERTHWQMYRIFREAQPKTPIVFASQCTLRWKERLKVLTDVRRDSILRNLEKAKALGDDRVFFVDGKGVYGAFGGDSCTVDGIHPNDLGFYAMTKACGAEIKKALEVAGYV